jgi:hypothetical protein
MSQRVEYPITQRMPFYNIRNPPAPSQTAQKTSVSGRDELAIQLHQPSNTRRTVTQKCPINTFTSIEQPQRKTLLSDALPCAHCAGIRHCEIVFDSAQCEANNAVLRQSAGLALCVCIEKRFCRWRHCWRWEWCDVVGFVYMKGVSSREGMT